MQRHTVEFHPVLSQPSRHGRLGGHHGHDQYTARPCPRQHGPSRSTYAPGPTRPVRNKVFHVIFIFPYFHLASVRTEQADISYVDLACRISLVQENLEAGR